MLRHSHCARGTVVMVVAISLPVLMGMAVLSIDVGYMTVIGTETQNAVDSAALAAGSALSEFASVLGSASDRLNFITSRADEYAGYNINTNSGGSFSTTVELGQWDASGSTFVALTGNAANGANAVRVEITRSDIPLFFAAIVGKPTFDLTRESIVGFDPSGCRLWGRKKVKLDGTVSTNSYNSTNGAYSAGTAGNQGNVCSCADIVFEGTGMTINGDASYVNQFNGNTGLVTGTVSQVSDCLVPTLPFGNISVDNDLIGGTDGGSDPFADLADVVEELAGEFVLDNVDDIIPDTSGGFSALDPNKMVLEIEGPDNLTLAPGNYYFTKVEMNENATLTITGPTVLYVLDEFDVHGGGVINVSQNPLDLTIILPGKKVHFKNTTDFYGYILAPNAKVKFDGGGDLMGAVVGKELEFKNGSDFHADLDLPLGEMSGTAILVR